MFSTLMTWNIPLSLPSSEIGCSKSGNPPVNIASSPLSFTHPTTLFNLTTKRNLFCPPHKILAIKIKGKIHTRKKEGVTTINTKMPIEEKQRRVFFAVVGVFFFSLLRRQLTLWMNGGMRKDQLMRRKENQKKSFQIHSVIDSAD